MIILFGCVLPFVYIVRNLLTKMPKVKEYSTDLKEAVIAALQNGRSQASVSRDFGLSRQIVSVWNRKFQSCGTVNNAQRSGRPRKTTERVDRDIRRRSVANPRLTAVDITRDINISYGVNVHVSTVKRRLNNLGLNGRRPSKKPLISVKNRKARLSFATKYKSWTPQQWSTVLFSDESKFNIFSSDGIRYVRRPVNTRDNVRYQVPTVKHGGGHVMVWGCFSRAGVGPLVNIEGIMDRFKYADILRENMLRHAEETFGGNWLFQHDNDPKHASKHVKTFLAENGVCVLEWPSQSPDLNPIEHLWDVLDRRIRQQNITSKTTLHQALCEEWPKIPISVIQKLIDSMPARCQAVIKSNGYATKY